MHIGSRRVQKPPAEMIDPNIQRQLEEQLDRIAPEAQRRVLDYAISLARNGSRGEAGTSLLRFAGFLDAGAIREITEAIESGCEQVDLNEW